jgi:1-deoxy-D-xylulose-5-phosphate reductoisomerase
MKKKNVVILGSTGSIGRNALDVVRHHKKRFQVVGLAANRNVKLMARQIREFRPEAVAISDTPSSHQLRFDLGARRLKVPVWNHADGMEKLARLKSADVVLCGVVGASGLRSLISALKAGKTVGLANKEALIMAGDLITALSKKHKAPIIPVDSEHSAIFQCLRGENHGAVTRLILTASGGPFYRAKRNLDSITVEEALNHPTWKMGSKITVDSATLMNKGLEAIEAHHLFGVPMEKISIVIHPQSIVHSLVEFSDGALLAQLSHPDMRLPIQYALTYPDRLPTKLRRLHLPDVGRLEFDTPDFRRFPCLALALAAGKKGGTSPAVLSAANEIAVGGFLARKISFLSIPKVVGYVLSRHRRKNNPTMTDVMEADRWARDTAAQVLKRMETNKK